MFLHIFFSAYYFFKSTFYEINLDFINLLVNIEKFLHIVI